MRIQENELSAIGLPWRAKGVDGPRKDRELQLMVLAVLGHASTEYGFSRVTFQDLSRIMDLVLPKWRIALDSSDLRQLVEKVLEKYIPQSKQVSEHIELAEPIEPVVVTQPFEQVLREVRTASDRIWGDYRPAFLVDGARTLAPAVPNHRDLTPTRFVVTSGIHGITEINDCIDELLASAARILWIMLAYYEDEIVSFKKLFAGSIAQRGIDFRIIYRDDPRDKTDTGCRQFVSDLRHAFGAYPKFEARAFSSKTLDKRFLPETTFADGAFSFRGRMHAKMIATEAAVLVTSANLLATSLRHNIEVGIMTRNPSCLQSALDFFEEVWRCLKPQS